MTTSQPTPEELSAMDRTNWVAITIDGKVEDIINCPPRLNALLLSSPVFASIEDPATSLVRVGFLYDESTGLFTDPAA